MPLEVKEVLKAFGLPEDIDSVEKAVEKHTAIYVPIDSADSDERVVSKVSGRLLGGLTTTTKKIFGLKSEDIKDKKYEDVLALAAKGLTDQINELKNSGSDEKLSNMQKELEKVKNLSEQYRTDLEKAVLEKGDLETNFNKKVKSFKIGSKLENVMGKLPFSNGIPEAAKIGFNKIVADAYDFDLDESENVIVMDKKGKRIPNPTKSNTYFSLDEVLDAELDKQGLKKKNNAQGNSPVNFNMNTNTNQSQNNGNNTNGSTVKMHPRYAKQMDKVGDQ